MKKIAMHSRLGVVFVLLLVVSGCAHQACLVKAAEQQCVVSGSAVKVESLRPGAGITRYPVQMRVVRAEGTALKLSSVQ